MAKSLRSKFKRKMRAIKRVRYGKKEEDRLKKMLANAENDKTIEITNAQQIEGKKLEPKCNKDNKDGEGDLMEVEKPKRNSKTLMDENGTFPVWMHPRQRKRTLKKLKAKRKK
ncbi:protein LLP homolog [Panonychus citri]|uniref:protein LLP homolog n=1 Tax=Panonychus citri TaxID=50023 RepID=UPI002307809E|nr:protein LLP homolog [Panonychus citri]